MPDRGDDRQTDPDLTSLLERSAAGDDEARDRLTSLVFAELHAMARSRMSGERRDHTLGATALVSETYLRLFRHAETGEDTPGPGWGDRRAFFSAAATAMRRILIDHARARESQKRGGRRPGGVLRIEADAVAAAESLEPSEFLSLDEAISRLEEIDERAAQVTRLRFFAGQSVESVAGLLGVSDRTVKRDWDFARAWLRDWLEQGRTT